MKKLIWEQGHKVVDLGVIQKGILSGACMPNTKPGMHTPSLTIKAKVKVDNRQTEQKQYAPDLSMQGHKKSRWS